MSAIDWNSVDWWELPGPSSFLEQAVDRICSDEGGVVGLALPGRRPTRLVEGLAAMLEIERGLRAIVVQAKDLDQSRSHAHALAAAGGASPGTIRSTADFVETRDLADMVFIVDGIGGEDWQSWSLFFRSFRAERLRAERITAPTLAVIVPQSVPHAEIVAALGTDQLRWQGVVSRADMQLYVESVLGRSGGFAHRTALATVAEVACWDPVMATHLADQPIEDQIDPRPMLAAIPLDLGIPSWSNGLVDIMDGAPHVHTLALVGSDELLARRIWRAHVGTIFPTIEQVRQTFVRRYFAKLAVRLPHDKSYNNKVVKTYTHPMELEINDVHHFLKWDIDPREADLLNDFRNLRTSMAHMEPANAALVVRASRNWDALLANYDVGGDYSGWDWPRCGQRLVLLVGPSGAGKSTYAAANFGDEVVISSDKIREELYGSMDMAGSQERVFALVRDRARRALAAGKSVVIDATNLRQSERMINAMLVPADFAVEYVLIDRPMEEKRRDGGWRLKTPGLLDRHAAMFAAELAAIQAGDGLSNVTVIDRRTSASAA